MGIFGSVSWIGESFRLDGKEQVIQLDKNFILKTRTLAIKNHTFALKTTKTTLNLKSGATDSTIFYAKFITF